MSIIVVLHLMHKPGTYYDHIDKYFKQSLHPMPQGQNISGIEFKMIQMIHKRYLLVLARVRSTRVPNFLTLLIIREAEEGINFLHQHQTQLIITGICTSLGLPNEEKHGHHISLPLFFNISKQLLAIWQELTALDSVYLHYK